MRRKFASAYDYDLHLCFYGHALIDLSIYLNRVSMGKYTDKEETRKPIRDK